LLINNIIDMEYNTSNETLQFPEYGRNVKLMIDYTVALQDPVDQRKSANAIITVMGCLNPQLRENPDYKHILWDHLAIMSDYKLAKYSPFPAPLRDTLNAKPESVPSYFGDMKFPTFGRIIEYLIEKAITIDDPDRRDNLIKTITNHMKKTYLIWNKEDVKDEVIFNVLEEISEGKLSVTDEGLKLIDSADFMKAKYVRNNQNNRNNNRNNQNNRNNNNGNQNRRYYR